MKCPWWILVAACILLAIPSAAHASESWIVVDAADGEVLESHKPNRKMPIASTTKMMTANVARASLDLDDVISVPGYNGDPAESLMGLQAGDRVSIRDLMFGLLLASGNDAAVALAEASSGSVADFVDEMNEAAVEIGLEDTSFANPIGLDDPDNYSTAADLASLAIYLRDNKTFADIVDTPAYTATASGRSIDLVNRNNLVVDVPWVDGVKTGRTLSAGNLLVSSGQQDGVELVAVVIGAATEEERDSQSLRLLEDGFDQYEDRRVVGRDEVLGTVDVAYRDEFLEALAAKGLTLSMRPDQEASVELRGVPAEVRSSVQGADLGKAVITVGGQRRGAVPVVASADFDPPTLLDKVNSLLPGPGAIVWLIGLIVVLVIALLLTGRSGRVSR